jgi:CBS domain-containing protein
MNKLRVEDVMTHLVVTLRSEDAIEDAGRMLARNRISGAPVVHEGKLVGVASRADLMRAIAPPHVGFPFEAIDPLRFQLRQTPSCLVHGACVGDVMSREVVSISRDASVWEAASLLDRHGFRRLPVIDGDGYVMGVLARSDLVRAMARTDLDVITSVHDAIGPLGLENSPGLVTTCDHGCVTIQGRADRRWMCNLAMKIAAIVPGVLGVSGKLVWGWDDTHVALADRSGSHDLGAATSSANGAPT